MGGSKSCRFNISILNIKVQNVTYNGSLNIGKTFIVKQKEKNEKRE